jgi:hypothetical protein
MVLKYLEEEFFLSKSRIRILKSLNVLSRLPPEKMIIELLNISNTTLSENACSNNTLVTFQNLMEDLEAISRVLALIETQLEVAKRDKKKSRNTCDNFLKMIGDSIDFYIKIVINERSNSTTDEKLNPTHITVRDLDDKFNERIQELREMSEKSQRVINATNYFEKGKHNHEHNYAPDKKLTEQELKEQVAELRQLVRQLQHDHQPTTEDTAMKVIDAEFDEIEKTNPSRWQVIQEQLKLLKRQALNPERHLNATKEALSEVAKHYLEESVVAKALITYLNTMSDDPTQGE